MKKITALLMAILVVVGATAMFASADDAVVFAIEDATVAAGDTLTTAITVPADSQIYCAEFTVTYDAEALELVSAKTTTLLGSGVANTDEAGIIKVAYAASAAATEAGSVLDLEFKAIGDGETAIDVEVTLLSSMDADYNEVALTADYDLGTITIGEAAEEPSEAPSEEPSEEPSEAPSEEPSEESKDEQKPTVPTGVAVPAAVFGLVLVSGAALVALKKRG